MWSIEEMERARLVLVGMLTEAGVPFRKVTWTTTSARRFIIHTTAETKEALVKESVITDLDYEVLDSATFSDANRTFTRNFVVRA